MPSIDQYCLKRRNYSPGGDRMARRLLRDPHVLAHELRTPLSILAGWYSLVRDGDISATSTPKEWECAMVSCQRAVERLNFIISQACDEASSAEWAHPLIHQRMTKLAEETQSRLDHSREVLTRVKGRRNHLSH
jgi:signal transduction histidine kinase